LPDILARQKVANFVNQAVLLGWKTISSLKISANIDLLDIPSGLLTL
jgi:hypothetical protein